MASPGQFLDKLQEEGIRFYTGVPDSLMKGFLLSVQQEAREHYITANEGAAVAMAAGYYLATGHTGLVYLQNSGLGNAVNPLTSLADPEVYGIPMLLMIGWRGRPGHKDEPQHRKMGRTTIALLDALEIPVFIFEKGMGDWEEGLEKAVAATLGSRPVALLIGEGFFEEAEAGVPELYPLSAEAVLVPLLEKLGEQDLVVCTTGKSGRLFYELNGRSGGRVRKYFLNVGAMGHASSLATALALHRNEQVVLLDGDGALLMQMGALALAGQLPLDNLTYILLNNGAHQSVGGQPTLGYGLDFCDVARGCGFDTVRLVTAEKEWEEWLQSPWRGRKTFTEVRIHARMPETLPRPKESFEAAKRAFMQALNETRNGSTDQKG